MEHLRQSPVLFEFATWGSGPQRVLFLHGFTGNRNSFDHLQPSLSDTITALTVDLPGHRSRNTASTMTMSFLETVDHLAGSLPGPTAVVGYSQGARLALALAVRHPHLVIRLVLESGSPGVAGAADRKQRQEADERLAEKIESQGVDAFVAQWEAQPLFSGLRQLPASMQHELLRRRRGQSAAGLASALRTLGTGAQPSYWHQLPALSQPTLLLSGSEDEKFCNIARRMAFEMPCAWHRVFQGVGHAPHLECQDDYARELRTFLNLDVSARCFT
jgi:2-succinyl-6-hydroxy-2,4-cyclohexadiene-1-carboxylate synthase